MGDFGFAQAALAGFDLLRRRPMATLGLALVGTLISFSGRTMTIVYAHFQLFRMAPAFANAAFSTAFMLVVIGGTIAIIAAGVARLDAGPDARGARTPLGGDEGRLFLLTLLAVPNLLIVLLALVVGSVIAVATSMDDSAQERTMWAAAAAGSIVSFGLSSRLWPAGVMTVRSKEMRLRAAWRTTRGRPWKTFAVFCLATTTALLIGVGGNILLNDVLGKFPAMGWSAYLPLGAALKSGFHPAQLGHLVLQGLIFGLGVVLQVAPATVIVAALVQDSPADQAAVFD